MASILPVGKARKYRPTKAAAVAADKRPLLQGAAIERLNGRTFLIVTDSHVAIRLPVRPHRTGEEVSEGYIPHHALPLIERFQFDLSNGLVSVGRARSRREKGEWIDGEPLMQFARIEPGKSSEDPGEYPSVEEVWPEKAGSPLRIHLDSKLVRRLAEALATDSLTLEIDLDEIERFPMDNPVARYEKPIAAWKYGHDRNDGGAEGVLMPMRQPIELKKPEPEEES